MLYDRNQVMKNGLHNIRKRKLQKLRVTFPSSARRSTTALINDLCSILHLCSGLLKSGLGHWTRW
jgi:hypothetical protein